MSNEKELMTIDEVTEFANHLCFSECSWEYISKSLAFFVHSLETRIATDQLDARDWLSNLSARLFIDVSQEGTNAHSQFIEDAIKFCRESDEVSDEKQIVNDEVLDLSNHAENLDINSVDNLADLLSKVLNHPLLPKELDKCIGDTIVSNVDQITPEYIKAYLTHN